MFFTQKVQTVGKVSDFLAGTHQKQEVNTSIAATSLTAGLLSYAPLTAAAGIGERVARAFDPLIEVAQALGYPVSLTMMVAGGLVIATGNRHKGLNMIKWAAIGFIVVQFAPGIMVILMEVGRAIKAA